MSDFSSIGSGMGGGFNGAVNAVNRLAPGALNGVPSLNGRIIEPTTNGVHDHGPDRVELSSLARYLDQLRQMPSVRQDLIAQVRKALDDGTYETDEKIDIAIDRLAEEESL